MKKKKTVKKTKTTRVRSRKTTGGKKLIYGLEQEFVLIFGGGFAVIALGFFFLVWH